MEKGQTSVDFIIGMSIFAVTILLVLQLVSTSVVSLSPGSPERDALADRAGSLVLANLTEQSGTAGVTSEGNVERFLDRDHQEVAADLHIPEAEAGLKYRYNVTAVELTSGDRIESTGNTTPSTATHVAGTDRVIYVHDAGGGGEMVKIEVKLW